MTEPTAHDYQPQTLATALDRGEQIQILDVRAPERVEAGSIELGPDALFFNVRGSEVTRITRPEQIGIDPRLPVATVCGHGNDSAEVAAHLRSLGVRAGSLAGGLVAWMDVVLPRDLEPPPSLDRLVQFDRVGKGSLGYLLASEGEALVVDPPLDAHAFLDVIDGLGATLVAVADTHVHADYVSGASALARRFRVPYYLHPADNVYPYDGTPGRLDIAAVEDGIELRVGRSAIRVQHTPGHTEGSVTFLVDHRTALTGDFLFVRSIGRPDLGGHVASWAKQLWASVERTRRQWSPDVLVCPAHYASDSERRRDRSVAARVDELLSDNEALAFEREAEFVSWIERNTASFPESYRTIKAVNVGLRHVGVEELTELEAGRNECALGGR
jgi:glyoxylase-like metal-dependent hydrolase (beta-lactamase superfamily II)